MIFAGLALLSAPAAVPPHEDAASCELDAQCTSAVWTVERWTEAVNEHDWSASVLEPTGPTADEYADAVLVWTGLAAWAPSPGGVDLWVILGVFSGPDAHTSALCVRWFYDASKDTLTEISRGLAAFERDGFLQPGDMMPELDLVFECSAFDMPVGLESALPATIVFDGQRYACQNVGFTDYDCVSYSGLEPPQAVASVDLRCSGSVLDGGFECTRDEFYPSALLGYALWAVDGQPVLCRLAAESWIDISQDPCWYWDGQTLPSEFDLLADFFCSTVETTCVVEDGTVIPYDLAAAYEAETIEQGSSPPRRGARARGLAPLSREVGVTGTIP